MHYGIDKFWIPGTKLITNIELQYYETYKQILISINWKTFQFDLTGKVQSAFIRFSMWWDENDQANIFKTVNVLSTSKFDFFA